jgi:hypothetical protein
VDWFLDEPYVTRHLRVVAIGWEVRRGRELEGGGIIAGSVILYVLRSAEF